MRVALIRFQVDDVGIRLAALTAGGLAPATPVVAAAIAIAAFVAAALTAIALRGNFRLGRAARIVGIGMGLVGLTLLTVIAILATLLTVVVAVALIALAVALRLAFAVLPLLLFALLVLLALRFAEHALVMLGMLLEVFRSNPVISKLRITGELVVFVDDLLGRPAHLAVGAGAVKNTIDDVAHRISVAVAL